VPTVPLSKSRRRRCVPLSPAGVLVPKGQAGRRSPAIRTSMQAASWWARRWRGWQKPWDRAAGLSADLRIHDVRHDLASVLAYARTPL
jgi:hypothetical protein